MGYLLRGAANRVWNHTETEKCVVIREARRNEREELPSKELDAHRAWR